MGKGIPGGFAGDLGEPSRGDDDPARRARRVSETGKGIAGECGVATAVADVRARGAAGEGDARAALCGTSVGRRWQVGPGVTVAERAAWAERGAGAERVEGGRPRAWAELARAAAALRPGCSERCCWARRRGELGRRSLGCGFGPGKRKGKARREGGLGWVFPWAGLFWVWASPRVWASFLFLNYTQTKLNSNSNLNSILALNQIKEMLRHDATTKN